MRTSRRVKIAAIATAKAIEGREGWFNRPPGRLFRRVMKALARLGVVERRLVIENRTRRYVYRLTRKRA